MKYKENKKLTVSAKKYYDPHKAPDPFREMVKAKIDAANAAKGAPGASTNTPQDDFQFQGNPGFVALLNWLIKISPPPAPREPGSADIRSVLEGPEDMPEAAPELPRQGAVQPSSSAWVIWLTIIILAAYYFFRAAN